MSNSECLEGNKSSTDNEINVCLQQNEEIKDKKDGQAQVQNNKVDESDEDVPGDFFDDFLKEDFMAGLDIVDDDEWDEDKIKNNGEVKEKSEKDVNALSKKRLVDSTKKRKKQKLSTKNNDVKGSAIENKERRSRQKKPKCEEKGDSKHKHNSDKQIESDEFDIRRDPEKTKRDIARDKVRCEKDKEMKIISEKLSLVETGLVPPGMEMEIDIEEIKRQKEKIENKSPRDLREHLKDLKGRNRSPGRREKSPLKKRSLTRRSPVATRRVSPLRRRSRSPRRDLLASIRSPRRSPLRRISPRRLSPFRHRSSERVYGRRRSRSHSPYFRSRRGKYSPYRHRNRSTSRESDREKWLKYRNRSRSPRRKRDEKKSFLQEIAEKLNEIRHPPNVMPSVQPMQPMLQSMQPTLRYVQPQTIPIPVPVPAPAPVPVPVPPPNNASIFSDSQQQYDPYDQNFFIGTPQSTGSNNFSCQPLLSPLSAGAQMPLNPISSQAMNSFVMSDNLTSAMSMSATQINLLQKAHNHLEQKPENQEDIAKLFQDKRITLSEFLAITAKPEVFSSSPTHLQEKVKVITRCHDAIKILASSEKKYSGRLIVYNTDKYKKSTDKYISPLKRVPAVLFSFTNPLASTENQKDSFTQFINELLHKLGLSKDVWIKADEQVSKAPTTDAEDIPKFSPPPPPLITPISNELNKGQLNNILDTNRLSKMVQTDIYKCENCEKRKKILYRSTAIQADNSSITFSVSTQVTEDDFQPKIPKTQSLAALTPAQLLAKSRESLNAATRAARTETDGFEVPPTAYNRSAFFRAPDNYHLPRPNLPHFSNSASIYDAFNSQISGGGGRGREPNASRTLDHNIRYSHNNYY